ncbi:MAG: hypothetical protein HPY85_03530 [Anaerolineae bacterium]|nr:hypothetical protein [Anaerolineae bacterium]
MNRLLKYTAAILLFALLLASCAAGTKTTQSPEEVYTQAAGTVQAQLTNMATNSGTSTPTRTPTNRETEQPRNTETKPALTNTPQTQVTTQSSCTNIATFVDDITYPDNAMVSAGETFTKTWKMMNTGTCTWTSNYQIILVSSDGLSAPEETPLTTGIEVPAGAQINISVTLQAPQTEGTYTAYFKFRSPQGIVFGINANAASSFYVKVDVGKLAPTATPQPQPSHTPIPSATPEPTET